MSGDGDDHDGSGEFESAAQRDAFFDRMKTALQQEVAEVKKRINRQRRDAQCATETEALEAGARAKLAEIDQQKALARI